MDLDREFGSLRTRIGDEIKDLFGGIQADINFGGGQPVSGSVSLGERRVLSTGALVIALVVGILAGAAFFGRGK
jgi:hypothetical protein